HDQVPAVGRGGAPAVVDDGGGTGLGDDRGSGDGPAGREFPPVVQGHVAPGAAGVEADGARGAGGFGGGGEGGEVGGSGDAGGFHGEGFDDDRPVEREGVRGAVTVLECRSEEHTSELQSRENLV